jgi:hypothetical protein
MVERRPLKETMVNLQKSGMTFTEIVNSLRVSRDLVVNELFWRRYGR